MNTENTPQSPLFTNYQKFVVGVLAFLQFTIVLDFMILAPLGAVIMPTLKISPAQFSFLVSVYAFSAGASGLLAAGFADRFDRKKILLFFYVGFLLGTLLCALAPTYLFLLVARTVTGLFGGVIGSVVFAITTDLFEYKVRGRVIGMIHTAFAASQILGIPIGLALSNHWGWHIPFLMIVILGSAAGGVIWFYLKPIDGHLNVPQRGHPLRHFMATLLNRNYVRAFLATALLSTGGFMLMPFGSAFSVHNLGIDLHDLPLIYLITGICTIVAGPLIGRASDTLGKFKVFAFGSVLSSFMVVIYTNLGITPLWLVISINSILFVGIFSRIIPSQTLLSAVPNQADRGSFMSVNSSIQQISGGIASFLAGLIVVEGKGGVIEHFDILGYVVVGAIFVTMMMMYLVNRSVTQSVQFAEQ